VKQPQPWPQPREVQTQVASAVLDEKELDNLIQVWKSGWIGANGSFAKEVESALSTYFASSALVVSNGSVAISLALSALKIGAGDEVLVPDLTYAATASVVIHAGATPVFCDVDLDSWNISTEDILRKITKKTKAIIVVHLYGLPADITSIIEIARKYDLVVIEDCAEAFGATQNAAKVGTFGSIGTFSFFPNKLITSGEGGLVTTGQEELFERMQLLRGQGMSKSERYYFLEPGFNYRMTELQACILSAQFKKLEDLWSRRVACENLYRAELGDWTVESFASYEHQRSPWIFTIRIPKVSPDDKIALASKLAKSGIETRPVFYPLSTMPAFSKYRTSASPNAELISREGISLPTGSHVSSSAKAEIIDTVKEFSINAHG
jgi:perosamine synthetase